MTDGLRDAAGQPVAKGDLLLADNGTVWRVVSDTDSPITRWLYASAVEQRVRRRPDRCSITPHGEPAYVPVYLWLKVLPGMPISSDRKANRTLFDRLYVTTGAAARGRAATLERHKQADEHARNVLGVRK